ncbi:hypothetical protein ACK2LO_002563 [Acinetobacter baumannii]|uniref:hypothetical protein n=1 Tax=Acinetobacter TaxID=469 RepID=UPI0002D0C78C|nr:hypothetical protein [Acinetobacter baumannii]EKT7934305.1 hypothetical protein [Acinetobacter baumannii]EKT8682807.1 hypothetical protein [Acinetobacter baumannii]EKT9124180.1 hypothetical protein [Acinetobacter baumannii]EKT9294236.1 hypothetical protein [Acinetobacter baumannii]EKU3010423.1 hypothetical protein [Acinetobacter baumannii]
MIALNNACRRFIFDFKFGQSAVLNYKDAEKILNERPDGAEFWDCSNYGKNFRKLTEEELKQGNELYPYTYDFWCPHSKAWISKGVATCKPYEEQTFVVFKKLENYMAIYKNYLAEVDQHLINSCLFDTISKMGAMIETGTQIIQNGLMGREGYLLADLERRFTELKVSLENLQAAEPGVLCEKRYTLLKFTDPSAIKRLQQRLEQLQQEDSLIRDQIKYLRGLQSVNAAKNLQTVTGIDITDIDLTAFVKRIEEGSDHINAGIVYDCLGVQTSEDFYKAVDKLIEAGILARSIFYQAFDDEPYDGYREDMALSEETYANYCKPDPETGEFGCPMTGEVITEQEFHENIYFTYSTTAKYAEAVTPYFS